MQKTTFQKLWEASRPKPGRDFWDDGPLKDDVDIDERSKDVILRGLQIRPDRADKQTFWDDFIAVIAHNADAAGKLLDVAPDVISGWGKKINTAVEKVRKENDQSEKRKNMVKTGKLD